MANQEGKDKGRIRTVPEALPLEMELDDFDSSRPIRAEGRRWVCYECGNANLNDTERCHECGEHYHCE